MRIEDLTEKERGLIRGMNYAGETRCGIVVRRADQNIGALHFDGQVLIEMVRAHRELERKGVPK